MAEELASLVGSPHHFLSQGMEIFLSGTLHDLHLIGSLAQGDACLFAAILGAAIQGYEEIMGTALYDETNLRIVGNNDRSDVQRVGSDSSH